MIKACSSTVEQTDTRLWIHILNVIVLFRHFGDGLGVNGSREAMKLRGRKADRRRNKKVKENVKAESFTEKPDAGMQKPLKAVWF